MDSLEAAIIGPEHAETFLTGKTALVLGAGGVGKAITYGLLRRDMRVVVTDGVPQQAIALAKHFDCRSVEWAGRHTVPADLIVNCTPLGMHPNVDETPYDKHYLRAPMIVFDVVYNPENTLLVKDARSRNCTVITGVDMFVRQACLQFQHFTGMAGPAELMRETLRQAIGAARHDEPVRNCATRGLSRGWLGTVILSAVILSAAKDLASCLRRFFALRQND